MKLTSILRSPAWMIALAISCSAIAATPPNIVLIVADDLGWADVGWHGSSIKTPHLDQLARAGVELNRHYVSPMCSPTRAALLSGRYASRFGVTAAQNERVFTPGTPTLPEALRGAGYVTALIGKWHLGSKSEWGPAHFGFDYAYGSLAGGTGPYNHHYKKGVYSETWHRNGGLLTEEGHVTDLLAREAVSWIEKRDSQPFFLYVPFTAPHIPIDEPRKWLDLYPEVEPLTKRHYAACVSHLDDAVGQIVAALERAGKRSSTLILFTSDNGAIPRARNDDPNYPGSYPVGPAGGSNLPLRGEKSQLYEGGIRVSAFVHWPAKLKPAKAEMPVHAVDWMRTLCAVAGAKLPADLKSDGQNVWPWLTGEKPPTPRALYWAGVNYQSQAVRDGDWKLILSADGSKTELFNLATDPNEQNDLAGQEPARAAKLKVRLTAMAAADIRPSADGVQKTGKSKD